MAGSPEWLPWVQTIGIISSFLFTGYQIRKAAKANQVANLLKLVEMHRSLWKLTIDEPELIRPFDRSLRGKDLSLTDSERRFVGFLMLHMSGAHALSRSGQVASSGDFERDVADLFASPAIRKFWEENKRLYETSFVRFVDSCVSSVDYPAMRRASR